MSLSLSGVSKISQIHSSSNSLFLLLIYSQEMALQHSNTPQIG